MFERLHSLVGTWEGSLPNGSEHSVTYRLTARDSALVETWAMPASEAVTVYSMDADELVATHFCPHRNAPRLRWRRSSHDDKLVFEFRDGTNLQAADQWHQHAFWLRLRGEAFERSETYVLNSELGITPGRDVEGPPIVYRRRKH